MISIMFINQNQFVGRTTFLSCQIDVNANNKPFIYGSEDGDGGIVQFDDQGKLISAR